MDIVLLIGIVILFLAITNHFGSLNKKIDEVNKKLIFLSNEFKKFSNVPKANSTFTEDIKVEEKNISSNNPRSRNQN